jgi:BirA family biotin operon repressor/biotin-[acetyl-CoA-carboxylase] ligase
MVSAVLEWAARRRLEKATRFGDVRFLASVGSTNDRVSGEARAGAGEGLVVVADHQEAGRGRRGRTWTAPPGSSLLASILLRPGLPAARLHLVGAVVSLSAADACRAVAGVEVGVKWPNDLVSGGRKLGGVLVEAELRAGRAQAVVAGVGLNVWWPGGLPPALAGEAVTLGELAGRAVPRADLLVSLLEALEARYRDLANPAGQDAQAGEYRRRCTTLGQRVRVELAGETLTGTAIAIDAHGSLVVDGVDGRRAVAAADVAHLRRG